MATLHAWFFMLVRRFRWLCLAVVLVLSGIAAAVLLKTDFSTDMLNLLPTDSSARQKLDIVIQSGILNKATIYFSKKDGSPFTENELDGFLPQTMADLKNLPGVNGCFWITADFIRNLFLLKRRSRRLICSAKKCRLIISRCC